MSLNKFTPLSSKDFVGSPKIFDTLRNAIREHDRVLLYGPPGVGKTSSVLVIGKELNYEVVETNASDERKKDDLKQIFIRCQQQQMFGVKILYLLDEVDGVKEWNMVENILKKSVHPVVLTANEEWRIPKKVKDYCTKIKFHPLYTNEVLRYIKNFLKEENVDYSGVSQDMRSSLLAVVYGGEKYKVKDIYSIVEDVFKTQTLPSPKTPELLPFLIDNAPQYYHGRDLYDFYQILAVASRTNMILLKSIPKGHGKGITYPYYLRRKNAFRRREM